MKIVIWLGNPWLEYRQTRHNVGFLFLDYLREEFNFGEFIDSKFKWLISEWNIAWEKIILLKPITYMNLSWESVSLIINFYKLNFEKDLIVVFDDLSMEFGKIRYRDKWSAGGHNGIKSMIKNLGSENFSRIKIWIWIDNKFDVSDWVLSKFTKDELDNLNNEIFPKSLEILKKEFIF